MIHSNHAGICVEVVLFGVVHEPIHNAAPVTIPEKGCECEHGEQGAAAVRMAIRTGTAQSSRRKTGTYV